MASVVEVGDLSFSEPFVSAALIVVGVYIWLLGYARYNPGKLRSWIFRIYFILVGYAFGAIIMLQVSYFVLTDSSQKNLNIMLVVLIPLGLSCIIGFWTGFGVIGLGLQLGLIVAQPLLNSEYPAGLENILPKPILIQAIGFFFSMFCLLMDVFGYQSFLSFFTTAAGITFILEGLSCFVDVVVVVRPFDFQGSWYTCTPSSTESGDLGIYYGTIFGGAFIGLILQTLIAKLFSKVRFRKKLEAAAQLDTTFQKHNRPKLKGMKPSLWHFVRHSGEYLSFRTHLKQLDRRLDETNLRARQLESEAPYADDSQYIALADQIGWLTRTQVSPAEVHEKAIKWLEEKANWDLLLNQPDDLFEMKKLNRLEWCRTMKEDPWGDFITLQAVVQVYQNPITLISSIWDPPVIEFPIIFQKKKKKKGASNADFAALKVGVHYVDEENVNDDVPEGVVTLVGADGKAVRIDKRIVSKSSTIASFVEEAQAENTNVIPFNEDPTLTGEALFRICKQLEAFFVLEKTSASDDIEESHLRYLDVTEYFGANAKPRTTEAVAEVDPSARPKRPILVSHYWGFHYGSLEASRKRPPASVLPSTDSQMRTWSRPHTRIALNRTVIVLIILSGIWWIMWMCIWGYRFDNVIVGIEFVIFVISETVNFLLAIVYNFNFWNPIHRRWKSLDKLSPPFKKPIIVNSMIFHYSEDVRDTQRTLSGTLRMKTTENTTLRCYVCDDGFWKMPPKVEQGPIKRQLSRLTRLKNYLTNSRPSGGEESDQIPLNPELPVAKSKYVPMFGAQEEKVLDRIKELYRCVPKDEARDMLAMMKQTVYRYYSEKLHCRVNVTVRVTIKTNEDKQIVRGDCAMATISYIFGAEYLGKITGPEAILIARVKPDSHHYKAGNINNAVFNERVEGEFAIFLDNDMKPLPDFVVRTVPWFFYFHELEKRYKIHKGMAFVQSPQFFKDSTIAGNHDFLGGRNSVFFKGIQLGRDGYDLCAFAGTNAIFRLRALHSVDGLPYGSLTEDAHLAIALHRYGYRSVYVEDRLAVGLAPVTVANSMQQRSRWVKGSVQIFLRYVSCGPLEDFIIWETESPFKKDTQKEVLSFGVPPEQRAARNFFRTMYLWDTMMYPFSAVTAIFYMFIALIFLITAEPPLDFTRPPFSFRAFLVTFLPYFALKFLTQYLSYNRVNADDIWVAQETWFGYSFASLIGVIDAFKENITGRSLGGWGVTGEGKRSSNLELFNLSVCLLLILVIIVRFVIFLIDPTQVVAIAAIFFAVTIVIQMWPMVSTSLYEYIKNAVRDPDEKLDLQRFEIPNYIIFTAVLIGGILVSVFAIGNASFGGGGNTPQPN